MADNQRRVLEMLAEKKISVDEAYKLLTMLGPERSTEAGSAESSKGSPKYLRVVVQPSAGADGERVNIRVPMALIRAGMKLTSLIPPHAVNHANEALHEKGVDIDLTKIKPDDIEQLVEALSELEVDVHGGREKVNIYVE